MAQHFNNEFIEQVRETADIIPVISHYLSIKKTGANYKACCPFHNEKTPSFVVSPQKQIFKCFGCGKAGNVFHFIMEIEGSSFPEAVEYLAKEHNIPLPEKSKHFEREQKKAVGVMEALNWAKTFFQRHLASEQGKEAREYLLYRGITKSTMEKFELGYAPKGWDNFLNEAKQEGFEEQVLLDAGLVIKKENGYYDRFRHRVIFPIWNSRGKVIAFGGRVLSSEDQPKYLNSPETSIFQKKKTLYAFHLAREAISQSKQIVIMEGYTDVLMAHQKGFSGAVATLGTALTPEHASFIKRYSEHTVLVFDGDSAGMNAASRSVEHFLKKGIEVRIAAPPQKLDPFDFLREYGVDGFREMITEAQDFFDFELQLLKKQHNIDTIQGKRNVIRELSKTIITIPDEITKRLFAQRMVDIFHVPLDSVLLELGIKKNKKIAPPVQNTQSYVNALALAEQNFVLAAVMQHPSLGPKVFEYYQPVDFYDPKVAKIASVVAEYIQKNEPIELASLSAQLEPEIGQALVSIYYSENLENLEKTADRLKRTIKGLVRQKKRAKMNKLRQQLITSAENEEQQKQILLNAQEVCKTRLRDIE